MSPDFSFFPGGEKKFFFFSRWRKKLSARKSIAKNLSARKSIAKKSDIKKGKVFGKIKKRGIRGMRISSCVIRVTEGETR